jgi:hypothetical protein
MRQIKFSCINLARNFLNVADRAMSAMVLVVGFKELLFQLLDTDDKLSELMFTPIDVFGLT